MKVASAKVDGLGKERQMDVDLKSINATTTVTTVGGTRKKTKKQQFTSGYFDKYIHRKTEKLIERSKQNARNELKELKDWPSISQHSNEILQNRKSLDDEILGDEIAKTDMSLRNKLYLMD